MKNDWDGSTDWSEGSVFAMLGMAMKDEALQLEGFQLIYNHGHLVEADLLPETRMGEGESELRWLMPRWMEELEETIKDGRKEAVEDLLTSITNEEEE